MEKSTISSILISSVCVLAVTVLVKVLNWVWLRPKRVEKWLRQQGIPGTSYKLFYGDLKQHSFMRSQALQRPMSSFSNDILPRVEASCHHLITRFGLNHFWWSGPTPIVSVAQPELVREALTKMMEYQKSNLNPIVKKLFPGLVNYEGQKWAKHRKMINPAFHMEKLKLMMPAFYDSCSEMVENWEKIVAEKGSGEINTWPYLTNLSADVISRAAFGSSYKEGQRIFELLKEQTTLVLEMVQSVYIPGLRYIPTAKNRRFRELENQIQASLEGVVKKRKEEIAAGEAFKVDLLGLLLDTNSKEIRQAAGSKKSPQLGMSLQELIDECKLFYFAGQETTSVLIVWTLVLLSKYQDWQTQARQEVLHTFGNDAPNFEGLNNLKTVTMILYEVLRLYPPATHLNRRIYKDTRLGGLLLPAGSSINIPVLFIHRDKTFWGDDAEEFKPERFSEGISKATRGSNAFFPFGWGPRICIGERFAISEAKMLLSLILQRFSFELSPSYVHAPMTVFFIQPQHGAQIIFRKL